jgi:hypothetical protein
VAHGARFDLDAVARVHDGLAIERDVVRELRCRDVGEQSWTGQAAIDGPARRSGLHDTVAARTGEFGTAMTDDAEVRAHVFKLLGYVFAQRFECATAFRAVFLEGPMHALFAFEVIGQWFATGTLAALLRLLRISLGGRTFVCLQVLKSQFKLLYLTLHLLRLATELHAAQLRNRQLQMLDLDYAGTELVLQFDDPLRVCVSRRRMRANQRLQRINVVGQVCIGQIHCDSLRPSAAHGSSGNRRLQSTARAYRFDWLSPVKPFEQE